MNKIAVIFESSPFDRKGLFNAVHNRVSHLRQLLENTELEVFCLQACDSAPARLVRKSPKFARRQSVVEIDGIKYNMLWYNANVFDYVSTRYTAYPAFYRHIDVIAGHLRNASLVLAHGYEGAFVAHRASLLYGIPYFANWHGSDVHTRPWKNSRLMTITRDIMAEAALNCFVSRSLKDKGLEICPNMNAEVLYNGVSSDFTIYDNARRSALRRQFGLADNQKVVAYAGNFYPVKNTLSLPDIFYNTALKYGMESDDELVFWIIGDGKQRRKVEDAMPVPCKFWGNQPAERMPDFMNCIDVLVLPSENEAFGLVLIEALACGANAVGSRVGGIAEILGYDFTVPYAPGNSGDYAAFVDGMSSKIAGLLLHSASMSVSSEFDWDATALLEHRLISRFCRQ